MGGSCGTHDKYEKCESVSPANGPRQDLIVTFGVYDPSKGSELFAKQGRDLSYKT
jgi:hypothetical protein